MIRNMRPIPAGCQRKRGRYASTCLGTFLPHVELQQTCSAPRSRKEVQKPPWGAILCMASMICIIATRAHSRYHERKYINEEVIL